jgi:hypothetical protein
MRQVAVAVPILGLLNRAILKFALLPGMTAQERRRIYSVWLSTPYPYAVSAALICAAVWFVFSYRGRYSAHGRKIAAFAMAVGALCGMLIVVLIRATWHI